MGADIVEMLDAVDRAVAAADGVVQPEIARGAVRRAAELRRRRGVQGQTLVLALAGGTGTGKSSLLNAVAGETVASVSRLRPHTQRPLAWVPAGRGPGVDDLLDDLGIAERVFHTRWPGLALLDLPDMDSVAESHHRIVEDLIPRVDGVVWVFDHTKYGDPTLFDHYLVPLREYRRQFAFVLNKVDTLAPGERSLVLDQARRRLDDAGYPDAPVFATAAAPGEGEPVGIAALEEHLGRLLEAKRGAVQKWLTDISRELRSLGDEAGVWTGAGIDLSARWARDRDAAVAGIVPGRGPGSRFDAVCRIEDLVAMVAVEAGPLVGSAIRRAFPEGSVETAVDEAASSAAAAYEGIRRRRKRDRAAAGAATGVLEARVGAPLRELLDGRARLGAALLEAALGVAEVEADLNTPPP